MRKNKMRFWIAALSGLAVALALLFIARLIMDTDAPDAVEGDTVMTSEDSEEHALSETVKETSASNDLPKEAEGMQKPDEWEAQVDDLIHHYIEYHKHHKLWDMEPDALARFEERFRSYYHKKYRGVPYQELPDPSVVKMEMMDEALKEKIPGWDGWDEITTEVWDEDLGDWREYKPTVYVDLSKIKSSPHGPVAFSSESVYTVDSERHLGMDEQYALLFRGAVPEGFEIVYIGKDGERLSPGERPLVQDPVADIRTWSDERLARAIDDLFNEIPKDAPLEPEPENYNEKIQWRVRQEGHRIGWMMYEDHVNAIVEVWGERSESWQQENSSIKHHASIASKTPFVIEPEPQEAHPSAPMPEEDHLEKEERSFERLLEAMRRAASDPSLSEKNRSVLERRYAEYLRLQDEAENRLRKGPKGRPVAPSPPSENPRQESDDS